MSIDQHSLPPLKEDLSGLKILSSAGGGSKKP